MKEIGNEEIVIVENKMKNECKRKNVGEEKVKLMKKKKR